MPATEPTNDTDFASREALLITLTEFADLPAAPDLGARVAAGLGDHPRTGIDVDLGVQFWGTSPTATTRVPNRAATRLLAALVDDVAEQRIGIDTTQRQRLTTLRANGWEPDLRGLCAVTGSPDAHGVPTPLPFWFRSWMRARALRHMHALPAAAGLPAFTVAGEHSCRPPLVLRYGYNAGLPEGIENAWGCRAVVRDDLSIAVPSDRVSMAGPDADRLVQALTDTVGDAVWRERVTALLRAGTLRGGVDGLVVVHEDEQLVIKASTLGEHGFVHLCAYFHGAR